MKDSRSKVLRYEKCVHLTYLDKKGRKYCRSLNDIVVFDADRCCGCPLWNGECRLVACEYYDLAGEIEMESQAAKKRAAGLIAAGICTEYPEFLDEKELAAGGAVYERALQFAAVAHKGAYRKGSKIPYIAHPVEVSSIVGRALLEKFGRLTQADYEIMAASALHDVVEDTDYSLADIAEKFNDRVAELVGNESEDKRSDMPPEESWRIRKEEFLAHLHHAPEEARLICLGDKLSNIRALKKDYDQQGDACFMKFNVRNKTDHEWYYRSVQAELSCWQELSAYKEFCFLINEIFS